MLDSAFIIASDSQRGYFSFMGDPDSSDKSQELNPEDWVEKYGDYLYSFAHYRVKSPEAAQDLVQETLLSAWKARESFAGRSHEKTWLTTILRNKIIDYYRKSGRESERFSTMPVTDDESDPDFGSWGVWKHYVPNWADRPDLVVENEDFMKVFSDCSEKLPKNLSSVFVLKYVEDMESEKICKALDISPSNLWTIMYRLRVALRKCLDKNWYKKND